MRGGKLSGGASLVEVWGLAWCLGVQEGGWEWLGWLCEAQRRGTCTAWKTVLGFNGGPWKGLGVWSFGKSGTIGHFVRGAGWFIWEVGDGVVE